MPNARGTIFTSIGVNVKVRTWEIGRRQEEAERF